MKLLALDTSSLACSVALANGNEVFERHEEQPREHTRILLPMIREILASSSLAPHDLDAIVLGNGPGSFIGMRIAVSVAQGMAYGADLGIVPVSSLAAVAQQVFSERDAEEVVVTQDAHLEQVYLGRYRCGKDGLAGERAPERIADIGALPELESPVAGARIGAGFGWQRYPGLLEANRGALTDVADVLYPRARYLLDLGRDALRQSGSLPPQAVEPAYLRQKVAEKPAP